MAFARLDVSWSSYWDEVRETVEKIAVSFLSSVDTSLFEKQVQYLDSVSFVTELTHIKA